MTKISWNTKKLFSTLLFSLLITSSTALAQKAPTGPNRAPAVEPGIELDTSIEIPEGNYQFAFDYQSPPATTVSSAIRTTAETSAVSLFFLLFVLSAPALIWFYLTISLRSYERREEEYERVHAKEHQNVYSFEELQRQKEARKANNDDDNDDIKKVS